MITRRWSVLLILIMLLPLALPGLASARQGAAGSPAAVDPQILVEMARAPDGRAGFFILFREQADLSQAYQIQDWEARGRFVYDRLQETAELSQSVVRAWLDNRGIPYRSFSIDNSLFVTADRQVLQEISAFPDVSNLRANYQRALTPLIPASANSPQATVPWNIAKVGADRVWQDFGVKGQGIIVADLGSGVDYTHDALFPNYRCGSGPHADCWYDPTGGCPDAPCDADQNGTLYMGIMAGDDAYTLTYSAGMAPDAQWIACRGCSGGSCSDFTLNACADWFMAPNGNPANRPHIVNNGWGSGSCDTWFQTKIQAWRAAGILPVFSIGGFGPACATIASPAAYSDVWATGATDANDNITAFSPRGPSPCGGVLKPEVSAPGVNICSTMPGNGWSCSWSGTSFSAAQSAGLSALLWSAEPTLIGDYIATAQVITSTAVCRNDSSCGGGPCPEPNNVYGWGRIDAYAAVQSLQPLPRIVVEPAALESTQAPEQTIVETLWITNTGTAPLTFTLSEYTRTLLVGSAPAGPLARPRANPVVDAQLQSQVQSTGRARAIIYLRELPDLSGAYAIRDWSARGRYVYGQLQQTVGQHAAALMARLEKAGAEPRLLLASGAIIATVDASLLGEIAARPEVTSIGPDAQVVLSQEVPGEAALAPDTVEWNIAQIGADRVWTQLGVTGQGAVVGNIGTGVMYTHPALVNEYRGNLGGGSYDHNYNWFDYVGGQPAPYDDVYHSTFGMGVAVGDDGGNNQIGVAPGARWVAVKACNSGFSCSQADLLAAMDWMLAPTDLSGSNPRPDLRPQVVLSMWGLTGCDNTFRAAAQAWRAAGMLPVFAPGGSGPSCGSVASPADLPESFTAGATDNSDNIASFSPRGPSCYSEIKPEVAAPGVNVRSANNTGGYQSGSGTSWSAAHLAGAAALVYSADPSLGGADVEALITSTAVCRDNTTCGGTACHNNVYGWGRIDAFAAVSLTLNTVPDIIPWLSEAPLTGTLDPGQGLAVAVTFDSTGLTDGVYLAGIAVASNDPNRPEVDVPVTMTVSTCDPVSGVDFAWEPPNPTVGQNVTLTGTATGTLPLSYAWDLGDGTLAAGQVVNHTYLQPGVYSVVLTVSNACGQAAMIHSITVNPLPCEPVSSAGMSWQPAQPAAGQVVTLTGVATGTWPISYAWDLGDGTTAAGQVVNHAYAQPGLYSVVLTASNACGQATAVRTITVTPSTCEPVSSAAMSWQPDRPVVGQAVTLTGVATGTLPMTYTWSFGDGLTGSGQVVSHVYYWPGSYPVTLTATNACGSAQATARLNVVPRWGAHVIALLAFDNDLAPYASEVIESFRLGTAANPGARATLLVDLKGDSDSEVVEIAGGVVTHTQAIPWLPGVHEVDTASGPVLSAFLQWARGQYPADRTIVTLLGHGVGLSPEVSFPQGIQSHLPPLPQFRDRTSGDVTSGTYLSTPELGRALAAATGNGASPFDLLFLDQCFQGGLDVLYEVRGAATVLVASPNYAWAAFVYDRYLPYFTSTATPEEMAQVVEDEYEAALDDAHPNAIFWVRAADVTTLGSAVSSLGDALRGELDGNRGPILDAALQSRFVDTTLCAGDLDLCPPDELMGLGSFARALQARFTAGSPVHTAAGLVLTQLTNVHGAYRTGNPWVKPEKMWAYTDTLTILAPLTPTLTPADIWRASIYTETAPLSAVWAPEPQHTVTVLTPLALTVDGRWDDFIAAWYGPLTPTVGQLCRAMPPAMVFAGFPSLTLTVSPRDVGADLRWGAYAPADHYGVYVLRPDGTTWEILDMAPRERSQYQHYEALLPSGPYRYLVAARDPRGNVLALSDEAMLVVGIMAITPTWGYSGIPASISISGFGFALPLTVTLDGVPLAYDLVSAQLVVADIPAGVAPGPHSVGLAMSTGQTIFYNGYSVVQPLTRIYLPCILRLDNWIGRR